MATIDGARRRTTAAILEAAAHVLAERGETASMADVAAAAGVSRATLYRHYPSREALLEALATEALADAAGRIAEAGLENVDAEEAISRVVRALMGVGDRYAVLIRERVKPSPEQLEDCLAGPIRGVFSRAIESGALRDDLPTDVLVRLFGGLLQAGVELTGERRLGLEDAAAAATAVFLEGARPPGGPRSDA